MDLQTLLPISKKIGRSGTCYRLQSNYITKHSVWFSLLVFAARLLEEGSKYVGLHSGAISVFSLQTGTLSSTETDNLNRYSQPIIVGNPTVCNSPCYESN